MAGDERAVQGKLALHALRLVTLPFKVPARKDIQRDLFHHLVTGRGRAPEQRPTVPLLLGILQLRAGETGPGLCWCPGLVEAGPGKRHA